MHSPPSLTLGLPLTPLFQVAPPPSISTLNRQATLSFLKVQQALEASRHPHPHLHPAMNSVADTLTSLTVSCSGAQRGGNIYILSLPTSGKSGGCDE